MWRSHTSKKNLNGRINKKRTLQYQYYNTYVRLADDAMTKQIKQGCKNQKNIRSTLKINKYKTCKTYNNT